MVSVLSSAPSTSFHRRFLPAGSIAFSSPEGRQLFREALAAGDMENYLSLAEHFLTQPEPSFCAISTLVMVLNALEIDPGKVWKGPWRWYHEDLVDCCGAKEQALQQGLTLEEWVRLAECQGAEVLLTRPQATTLEAWRESLSEIFRQPEGEYAVIAYSRKALGQSGDGHFSPLGGYHAGRDLVLVLDVARFKYPPHWVALPRLWEAMLPLDPQTGLSRGFLRVRRASRGPCENSQPAQSLEPSS